MLNQKQKDLILDLYFGCGTDSDINDARALIAANSEASTLYDQLESQLDVMGRLKEQTYSCPDHLAQSTIEKLKSVAKSTENIRLNELLEKEQEKVPVTAGKSFWKRAFDAAAVAAGLLIMAGIYFPTVNNMRYQSWKTACQANMAAIASGIGSYISDNDGMLPAVEMKKDAPWWKVGYQGEENHSNTRNLWQMVQGEYVKPGHFVCPGKSHGRAISLDRQNIDHLRDFPSRRYITYSSRLMPNQQAVRSNGQRIIFISDANPLFEKVNKKTYSPDSMEFKAIKLCERLINRNSLNHRKRGQNVMFTDGSVKFFRVRKLDLANDDDIFTVRGTETYSGCESPNGETDIFMVP